ncbi:hypothetical protein AALC17_03545 [Oscillospiraceae bacterium 38-13]
MANVKYYIALNGPAASMRRISKILDTSEELYPTEKKLVVPVRCLEDIQNVPDSQAVSLSWCSQMLSQSNDNWISEPFETLMATLPELKGAVMLQMTHCGLDGSYSLFSAAGSGEVEFNDCYPTDDEGWPPNSDKLMREFCFPGSEKKWLAVMWTKIG